MEYTEWIAYFALKGLKPEERETDVSAKIKNALGAPPKKGRKKGG
jgi:hypothetical protein